ncbi:MAG: VOC family protein [FCB group bacterium]|nr:VOC family protein [FCB group bacterium]
MKIKLNSIYVDNQEKALSFYTEKLGFKKKTDIPIGEFRWLTVVSPEDPEGTQLVLEPNNNPSVSAFQASMFKQGIPLTAFEVKKIQDEYTRMKNEGVIFTQNPKESGPVILAIFEDGCGNLIQIYQIVS